MKLYKYKFKCSDGHVLYKKRTKPYKNIIRFRCPTCGLYMRRDMDYEKVIKDKRLDLSYLKEKRLLKSDWLENLEIT